jgi:hypothetical protein
MLEKYFTTVRSIVQNYSSIFTDFYSNTIPYDEFEGFIEGKITFIDGSILDFGEVKNVKQQPKMKYRYHYMDKDKNLIFRYDNAAHHKEIATFPHHKHTPNGVEESNEPAIETIMKEIEGMISK